MTIGWERYRLISMHSLYTLILSHHLYHILSHILHRTFCYLLVAGHGRGIDCGTKSRRHRTGNEQPLRTLRLTPIQPLTPTQTHLVLTLT